jgi:uncharacterized NAD(P)/FAD-binding protein YdhS
LKKVVAIVGAGFSGSAVAIQLLGHLNSAASVILIDSAGRSGGVAYRTPHQTHLLNVPAGNMSALPEDQDSFVEYCRRSLSDVEGGAFVPRAMYARYLTHLLDVAKARNTRGGTLERLTARVVGMDLSGTSGVLKLATGERIHADHVVLATGHLHPNTPSQALQTLSDVHYVNDPWAGNLQALAESNRDVLLVGSGLTSLDVIRQLRASGHRGTIFMVSRRGLMPNAHRDALPSPQDHQEFLRSLVVAAPSVTGYLRLVRRYIGKGRDRGWDWRDVIAALRPITPQLWQRLNRTEKLRFRRHLQVFWDVHRHRIAPYVYDELEHLRGLGIIKPVAGAIGNSLRDGDGVRVFIRLRGSQHEFECHVARIINCTGPGTDVARAGDVLVDQLVAEGVFQSVLNGMGIRVDGMYRVSSELDQVSYIGPLLRAEYWEATAVPELRQHAFNVAHIIFNRIG